MLWLRGGRREGAASLLVLPPLPRLCTLVPGPLETSLCALELLVLPCIVLRISWPLAPPETRNGGYTENAEGLLLAQPLVVRSRSCACMSSVSTSRATWNLVFLLTYPVVFFRCLWKQKPHWNWKAARKALRRFITTQNNFLKPLEIIFTTQNNFLKSHFIIYHKTARAPSAVNPKWN